jgi:hemoglobin
VSIFDSIGGAPAVRVAVDKFYERVLSDPQLAHYFGGVDTDKLKSHQRAFIAAAIGGPDVYQGRDMAKAHSNLGITDSDFDAVVRHLVATLTELRVPNEIIADIGNALAPLRSDIVSVPPSAPSGEASTPTVLARSVTTQRASWMASLVNRIRSAAWPR